jgi:hypothetical protein
MDRQKELNEQFLNDIIKLRFIVDYLIKEKLKMSDKEIIDLNNKADEKVKETWDKALKRSD